MAADKPLRITSVMGVARALLATFEPWEAVDVLHAEFGWDVSFQALVLLRGDEAERALLLTLEALLTTPLDDELGDVEWRSRR